MGKSNSNPSDTSGKLTIKDKTEFKTLEEFFAKEKANAKEIEEYKKTLSRQNAIAQQAEQKRLLREYVELEGEAKKLIAKDVEEYRKTLIEKQNKEDLKRKLEIQNRIYKEQVEQSKKSVQQQNKQTAIKNQEDNLAWLKKYQEIESGGGTLTSEQQQDKKQREEQLNLAKQALREEQLQTNLSKSLNATMNATLNAINAGINTYAKYQGGINARLQGSSLIRGTGINAITSLGTTAAERLQFKENTFGILEHRLTSATGIQPYVRTETLLNNLDALVKSGIAANVEQRAFLNTIKENIADTFDAANASLLRIIRLQQSDSTAARLGMEAYLTRFLNQMVENTEYLNQTFDNVESALVEASSQMTMEASTEFEYVVQKWLGALSGTGLAESTANQLAEAIGYLGSGNVSGFGSSSMQGLLTIAASRSGMDIGSLLNNGLNASSANALLNAVANYMVEIGSNQNNVVRSQLAQTFGLNVSDIRAAQQLSKDFNSINNNMLSYWGMYGTLNNQMLALPTRLSMGEMIQNVFDNSMFSLAEGIAGNPALAAIWKITDMIQSTTGGINIPAIEALTVGTGGMLDLNTSVENLMKLGIVGISSLGMIGDIISGVSSSVLPSSMLWKLGITSSNTAIARGGGLSSIVSGFETSQSAYIANSAGGDYYEQSLQKGADDANNNETIKPQTDESQTDILPNIDQNVEGILNVLKEMKNQVDGLSSKMEDGIKISNLSELLSGYGY